MIIKLIIIIITQPLWEKIRSKKLRQIWIALKRNRRMITGKIFEIAFFESSVLCYF